MAITPQRHLEINGPYVRLRADDGALTIEDLTLLRRAVRLRKPQQPRS